MVLYGMEVRLMEYKLLSSNSTSPIGKVSYRYSVTLGITV